MRDSLRGVKILVADDNDDNRFLIEHALGRAGAKVESVANGKDAIDRAMAAEFDVILMDMQMPIVDGFEATAKLRELGVKQPIIALTAYAMQADYEKTKRAGCSAHLPKPIDLAAMIATIVKLTS